MSKSVFSTFWIHFNVVVQLSLICLQFFYGLDRLWLDLGVFCFRFYSYLSNLLLTAFIVFISCTRWSHEFRHLVYVASRYSQWHEDYDRTHLKAEPGPDMWRYRYRLIIDLALGFGTWQFYAWPFMVSLLLFLRCCFSFCCCFPPTDPQSQDQYSNIRLVYMLCWVPS